ncbi:hypothetical protein [Nostoc linckia]|nr:hypothetical protein [Nostoc linckia]
MSNDKPLRVYALFLSFLQNDRRQCNQKNSDRSFRHTSIKSKHDY